ncbi:hypothetical protein KP79_PYT08466 [Mizuhopecten yessoensis]|uniref:SGNH hydrolase-type esterase domain-containing protein n=1 Tax=Mizuhopecten yessoensis TaxID=6573 RepID=A0A210PI57_MIZYE|nr:hypothetical protein KP79_PYT08466 [Mizuhopecten yessoensis]
MKWLLMNKDIVPGTARFFGKGGMRADSISRHLLVDLTAYNPDILVIQLGGNDISATSSPNYIFQTLIRLQMDLYNAGIKEVYFAGIVPRGHFGKSPGLTATSFEKQRNKINQLMMTRLNYIKLRVKLYY